MMAKEKKKLRSLSADIFEFISIESFNTNIQSYDRMLKNGEFTQWTNIAIAGKLFGIHIWHSEFPFWMPGQFSENIFPQWTLRNFVINSTKKSINFRENYRVREKCFSENCFSENCSTLQLSIFVNSTNWSRLNQVTLFPNPIQNKWLLYSCVHTLLIWR